MLTQHTPRLPHRPAPARHDLTFALIAFLAIITVVMALLAARNTAPTPLAVEPVAPQLNPPLGIVAPAGMSLRNYPHGYTDYVLPVTYQPVLPAAPLGIYQPGDLNVANYPQGFTDYLIPVAAELVLPVAPLGIYQPGDLNVANYPQGYTDYLIR